MSSKGCMPIPEDSAELIITAKPGKTSWALEEVADTLLYVDPNAEVVQTVYEGVMIAKARTSIAEAVRVIKRFEYAFISFITPVLIKCIEASTNDVINTIAGVVRRVAGEASQIALRVKLRGKSKEIVSESLIEEVLTSRGVKLSRKASKILVVEGIDDYVGVSYGSTRPCGAGCTLVDLDKLTII